jgi:biotin carboxylase
VRLGEPEAAATDIVAFARTTPVRAVVAADDEGALAAALAATQLGLPHHAPDAVVRARSKLRSREAFRDAGLPGPSFRPVPLDADAREEARVTRFPCVLKPLVLSASRGVMRADDEPSFVRAFDRIAALLRRRDVAAAGGEEGRAILVEDYLPGDEVAVEGLCVDGHLHVLAVFDKPDPLTGPTFEETIYVTPSRRSAASRAAIEDTTARAVSALGLGEGPVHAELRVEGARITPLEIAPRSIGGLCSRALRFAGGESLEEIVLARAVGLVRRPPEREARASGVMMVPIPGAGVLRGVRGEAEARAVPGIEDVRLTIPVGDRVVPLPEGARYLGFLFARAGTPGEVEDALRAAHGTLAFDIRDEPSSQERAC